MLQCYQQLPVDEPEPERSARQSAAAPSGAAAMSRHDGLVAVAAVASHDMEVNHSKDAKHALSYLPSFVRRVNAHQFLLTELPPDLREALADYDVDGDGAHGRMRTRMRWTRTASESSTLCARRDCDGGRDRGGCSPPAPAEEKGTRKLNCYLHFLHLF